MANIVGGNKIKVDQLLDNNKNRNKSKLGKIRLWPNLEETKENFSKDYDDSSRSSPSVSSSYISSNLPTKIGKNDSTITIILDKDIKSIENIKEGLKKGISQKKVGSKA